jgi:cytoskeletal protein CcmA (bactofilin family)
MWKPTAVPTAPPAPEPAAVPRTPTPGVENSLAARVFTAAQQNVASVGKSITIKGEISGAESLHIEGRVEGAIHLSGAYLNIGPEAVVHSHIEAREVVVRGVVVGNVNTSERIDIRNGGSLTGDVSAHSVSIEEGAYFKGSIDMRRSEKAQHPPKVEPVPRPQAASA